MESIKPIVISNIISVARTCLTLAMLFSALYWAVYFIVAWSIPKSRKVLMRLGPISTTETIPISATESVRPTIIVPSEVIIVERATPQNRLKPPLAETFPRFWALLTETISLPKAYEASNQSVIYLCKNQENCRIINELQLNRLSVVISSTIQ